jgi:hypothetical protein
MVLESEIAQNGRGLALKATQNKKKIPNIFFIVITTDIG